MQKKLMLVKPKIGKAVIRRENLPPEHITFLDIPEQFGMRELELDIRTGAVQFKELVSLVEKRTSPASHGNGYFVRITKCMEKHTLEICRIIKRQRGGLFG